MRFRNVWVTTSPSECFVQRDTTPLQSNWCGRGRIARKVDVLPSSPDRDLRAHISTYDIDPRVSKNGTKLASK